MSYLKDFVWDLQRHAAKYIKIEGETPVNLTDTGVASLSEDGTYVKVDDSTAGTYALSVAKYENSSESALTAQIIKFYAVEGTVVSADNTLVVDGVGSVENGTNGITFDENEKITASDELTITGTAEFAGVTAPITITTDDTILKTVGENVNATITKAGAVSSFTGGDITLTKGTVTAGDEAAAFIVDAENGGLTGFKNAVYTNGDNDGFTVSSTNDSVTAASDGAVLTADARDITLNKGTFETESVVNVNTVDSNDIVKINTGDTSTLTFAEGTVGVFNSAIDVNLDQGTVTTNDGLESFTFNKKSYTVDKASTFGAIAEGAYGLVNGSVSGVTGTLNVLKDDLMAVETVTVQRNQDGVTVTTDGDGRAAVSGLSDKEEVEIVASDGTTKTVLKATGTTVKAQTYADGTLVATEYYNNPGGGEESGGTTKFYADGDCSLDPLPTGVIRLSEITEDAFYTAGGQSVYKDTDGIVVTVNGKTSPKTVAVTGEVNANIYLDEASKVTDSTGAASFYIKRNNREETIVSAKGFNVSSEGVISGATGTVTLLEGTDLALSGTVNIDVTAVRNEDAGNAFDPSNETTTSVATYVAGTSVNGAKIKFDDNSTLTLTETTNSNDTVIYNGGSITGLDAGAVVTGAIATTKITTTGSETAANTYTINKKTITVTGDDSVDITVTNDDVVTSTITGLAVDATLDMAASFSEYNDNITVNDTTFTGVTSKNGLTFVGASGNEATVTLNAKGEKVTIETGANDYTYELKSSSSSGVTIEESGRVTGLTNGDTLVITNTAGDKMTLTANNNGLVVDYVDFDEDEKNNSTTYSLDSGETSFTATIDGFDTSEKTGIAIDGGTAGEEIDGFSLTTGSGDPSVISSVTNGMWLDKDNNILADNSSNKAVAQMNATDSTITYTEIGDKSQTLNITDTTHDWNIVTNGGKDDITFNTTSEGTISSGAGSDTVKINGNGIVSVNAGDGNDKITIGANAEGDDTIVTGNGKDTVEAKGKGDVVIDGRGTGNKLLDHSEATAGDATLYGGDGDDTILARGMDDSVVGGAGKDVFAAENSMAISDYQFGTDIVSIKSAFSDTTFDWGTDGVVSMSNDVQVDVSAGTGTGDYYAVTAKDSTGAGMNVGWTGDNGGNIDASSVDKAVVLIGSHNDEGKDLLIGGAKGDSLYGGTGDSVYGGAGKDTVSFAASVTGAYVGVASTSGKDEVNGFKGGFDATEADSIYLVDGNSSSVKVSVDGSDNITFKNGDGSLLLNKVAKDTTGSGAYQLLVSGQKLYTVAEGGTVSLTGDNYGDYYIATKNGIADLSKVEGNVTVDLADTDHIRNFNQIKGGAGNTTLMGSGVNSTLTAGTGNTSLWGGAGRDSLVGGTSADMFVFMNGDGSDTISGFSAGTSETSDTLNLWTSNLAGVARDTNAVKVTVEAGDVLTLTGTSNVNDKIQWKNEMGAQGVAKIGVKGANNTFSYEDGVTNYIGSTGTDVVSLTGADDVNVWLDGSQGASYAGINAINASGATGNLQLAGDTASQSIVGGRGDTSLWGGAGKTADTLTGGNGVNTFFYGAGEGNDLIVSTSANDSVNLYNLRLSDVDVANTTITDSGVSLALNDGSKLTVQTNHDMTFSIDGQSWTSQRSSKEWKQNS